MNPALWTLMALQLNGWARYFFRSLTTFKGALLFLVGVAILIPWLLSMLLLRNPGVDVETVRAVGLVLLLFFPVSNVVFASGERGIYFSPAEINFLFSGPFTRREILAYKVLTTILLGLPTALFLTLMLRIHAPSLLAVYVGVFLGFLFVSLLQLALNLIIVTIGAGLYSRLRKLLLGVVVLVVVGLVYSEGLLQPELFQSGEVLERLNSSPIWQTITWPLRPFIETFLATRVWPDLVFWASLASLVDLALLGVVFWLDANYLETSAVASARTYARIQKLRSGNVWAGEEGVTTRLRVPPLPYWGGIGPILWRQLTVALRGLGRLAVLFVLFGVLLGVPLFGMLHDSRAGSSLLLVAAIPTLWFTIILTTLIPFDFRGDVDRMAILKTLPISAWRLTVGQMLTPTLLVSSFHWLALGAILVVGLTGSGLAAQAYQRSLIQSCLTAAVFVLPFNFLLFGLENLLFLLFPSRVLANQPGDFQAVGRNVLFVMAKFFGLALAVGVAAAVGGVLFFIKREEWLGLAGAWMVLTFEAALMVPLVAAAFTWFDVGRDTPP